MRAKAIICVVAGHHWTAPADASDASPIFVCDRCGRAQEFAAGTITPFNARVGAETARDNAVGPFGPRR